MFSGGGALTQGTGYTGGGRAAESGKQPGNTTCAAAETAGGGGVVPGPGTEGCPAGARAQRGGSRLQRQHREWTGGGALLLSSSRAPVPPIG